jgi:hypothetical protein
LSDYLFTFQAEIPAVSIVDKDMRAIREEPADELGLVLDHIPVPLFTLSQQVLAFCQFIIILPDLFFPCFQLLVCCIELLMVAGNLIFRRFL